MRKKIILGYFILLLGLTTAEFSIAKPVQQPGAETAQAQPDTAKLEERIAKLEESLQDEKYAKDMANIRADLIESQRDWYAVLMTLLGIAVAGTTIFFTLRFGSAAVSAAKAEIIEQKAAIDSQLSEAAKLNEQARKLVEEISDHANQAKALIDGLSPGEVPTDDQQRETISDVAQRALAKPRRERTLDDYKALVIHAMIEKDWVAAERRAQAITYLFEGADPESIAFAQFHRAYALGELSRHDDAIAAYEELIYHFGKTDLPALQEPVAKALLNKGFTLGALGRHDDEIAAYDELIDHFGKSDLPVLQERVAKALFNKGSTLGELGRHDDAIAVYDELTARFGNTDLPALQEPVTRALFNLACGHALAKDVAKSIDALKRWYDKVGSFDCEKIAKDADFDSIRHDPEFVAFLTANGCPPPEPPPPLDPA